MEKLFKLRERGTTVRKEIIAGITTFLTMAYILAVNPGMLGQIGNGMTAGSVFTGTVIASVIACLVMGFTANLPLALAPGMGLNAIFTFTVVFGMGYSWQIALTAVFLEGILFVILSAFNVREAIINAIPTSLKKAVAVGLGFFIAFIGLQNAGIVVQNQATLVSLGNVTSGSAAVALIGFIIMVVLYLLKVPGAVLIAIIISTFIGIPFGVTKIPENFTVFSMPHAPNLFQFDFSSVFTFKFFTVFFTFFFVDFFDTIGTLVGVTSQAKLIDKDGKIPNAKQALLSDAIGTVVGACVGTSTVTTYVESSAGVAAGGRTGLTAVVTGLCFLLALFLSPLFILIPSAASAPALIFVGFLMLSAVTTIDFSDPSEGIPAFMTIAIMPFTYSPAEGIVFGLLSYVVVKVVTAKFKDISLVTWILAAIFILRFFLQ